MILDLKAHAKINLFLRVGEKDPAGYHRLNTVFQSISLHDCLRFRVLPSELRLRVNPPVVSASSDNLVLRALALLRRKMRCKKGMEVTLQKRIPVGAGLGGGSSDAATALWGGWMLWAGRGRWRGSANAVPKILLDCAGQLGADVPFFLRGGSAVGEARGDVLTPLELPAGRPLVLVYPRVHVSTARAYAALDQFRLRSYKRPPNGFGCGPNPLRNDFEDVILKNHPMIGRVKKTLLHLGCSDVLMSGSGSSVFGFVPSAGAGRRIVRLLSGQPWDVFFLRTI